MNKDNAMVNCESLFVFEDRPPWDAHTDTISPLDKDASAIRWYDSCPGSVLSHSEKPNRLTQSTGTDQAKSKEKGGNMALNILQTGNVWRCFVSLLLRLTNSHVMTVVRDLYSSHAFFSP